MNSQLFLNLFSSWQIVVVCILVMVLLPSIFYLSSLKPAKKRFPAVQAKPAAKKKPEKKESKAETDGGSVEEEEIPVRGGK